MGPAGCLPARGHLPRPGAGYGGHLPWKPAPSRLHLYEGYQRRAYSLVGGPGGVAATSEARQLRTPWLVGDPSKTGRRGGERGGPGGVAATSEARQLRTPWLVGDPSKTGRRGGERGGPGGVAATSEARQLRTPWLVGDPSKTGRRGGERGGPGG